jgi:type IV secretory pathway protease TraF
MRSFQPFAHCRHPIALVTNRRLQALTAIGFGLSLLGVFLPGRVLIQARTPHSVALTLGIRLAAPPQWRPGDLVAFRTRDLRPYYPAGAPFAKVVAGVGGQPIARLGRDFYIAGRYVATARERDSAGRAAPLYTPQPTPDPLCRQPAAWVRPVAMCRQTLAAVIPEGHLFTLGQHERSFDSRYWGLVAPQEITGRVAAIF